MSTHAEIAAAIIRIQAKQSSVSGAALAKALRAERITTVRGRRFTEERAYYYKDIPKASAHSALRHDRLVAAQAKGRHTKSEWQAVLARANGHCECCGEPTEKLQKDHIQSLCKAGSDSADNLRAVCPRCSSSRGPHDTPLSVYIKELRMKLGEDVAAFGARFERSGRSVEDWEQGRRQPDRLVKKMLASLEISS